MLLRVLVLVAPEVERRLTRALAAPNVAVLVAAGERDFMARLEDHDLVIVDRSSISATPAALVERIGRQLDRPAVIFLEGREDATGRAELLAAGGLAVLNPTLPDELFFRALGAVIERRRELVEARLRAERPDARATLDAFTTRSPALAATLAMARKAAGADSSLLILGETGVGKEWLARAIHAASPRAGSPFLAVNCAALPDALLESELFGHEKGAFTGAERARRGAFELAHRGTLFLDEIAEMAPKLQAKLLRAVQERELRRLGGEEPFPVDVRIVAATSRGLRSALAREELRPELYYRLAVVTLTVPPLRERREDVAALVQTYLAHFREKLRRPVDGIDEAALEVLIRYRWPGNVRELINVVERAVLLCEGRRISLTDPAEVVAQLVDAADPEAFSDERFEPLAQALDGWLARPLPELRRKVVDALERSYLAAHLARSGGRVGDVARRSGLGSRALYDKMRMLGLHKEDFRH